MPYNKAAWTKIPDEAWVADASSLNIPPGMHPGAIEIPAPYGEQTIKTRANDWTPYIEEGDFKWWTFKLNGHTWTIFNT